MAKYGSIDGLFLVWWYVDGTKQEGFFKILGEAEDLGDGVRFGHPFGVVFPLNSGMSHFMLIRAEWKMEDF